MRSTTPETITIPDQDLPIWMRKARQGTDWGVLVVLAFSLIAAWPFIVRSDIPAYGALENHAYRGAEYAQSFREQRLYPRWSATALAGYGAPIHHYYPPGVPYIIGTLEVLVTGSTIAALRIVLIGGFMLIGTTTYAFVTRYAGATVGVLAALLYVFSPHASVTVPFLFGDVPQFVAMGLLPALLWSLHRLLTMHRPLDFSLSVLIAAGIVLVYPVVLPVALLLSLVLAVWHVMEGDHKPRVLLVGFAWMFTAVVTTFYWLPAIAERDLVQWRPQALPGPDIQATLLDLISNLAPVDPLELAPPPELAIGWSLLLFAVLGALLLFADRKWRSLPALLLATALCLIGVLLIDGNAVWLVGPVSLCLAVVGGELAQVYQRLVPGLRSWALAGLIAAALGLAYPHWLPPTWPQNVSDMDARAMIEYERRGYGVATLPPGAEIPTTLVENIAPNFELISSYGGENTVRLRSDQLAVGSQVSIEAGEIHADSWVVSTSPLIVDVQRANFVGWVAYLDGERIPLLTDPETGLMQIVLPRTEQASVQIRLETTSLRRRAWWLSAAAFVLVITGLVIRLRRPGRPIFYSLRLLDRTETRVVLVVLAGFVVVLLMAGHPDALYSLYRPGYWLADAQAVNVKTADGMVLRGFKLHDRRVRSGDELAVTLYWGAEQALERNFRVALVLENAETNTRALATEPHTPGHFPAQRWITPDSGAYVRDEATMRLPPSIALGRYRLAIEVYDCVVLCDLAARRQFVGENGESIGMTLPLTATVLVEGA